MRCCHGGSSNGAVSIQLCITYTLPPRTEYTAIMEETPPPNSSAGSNGAKPVFSYATPGLGSDGLSRPGRTVTVGRYSNEMEASMHAALLDAEHIYAKVLNSNVNSMGVFVSGFTEVEVQVHEADAARAMEILNTDLDELEPVEEPPDAPPVLNERGEAVRIVPAGAFDNVRRLRAAQTLLASASVRAFPPRLIKRGERPAATGKRFVLQVFEEDLDRAQALLDEAETQDQDDDDPHCPKCHSWRVFPVGQFWTCFAAFWHLCPWPQKQMECLVCHHRGLAEDFVGTG
jgi:hypothetical protein